MKINLTFLLNDDTSFSAHVLSVLTNFCLAVCAFLKITPPEIRPYHELNSYDRQDPFNEPDFYHLSDPLDVPNPFDDDPCYHPLNHTAKYSYFDNYLYVQSADMLEEVLDLLKYAVARELVKKWILTNRDTDWYHYPCSEVPNSWYLLMIPDAFATVLMTHFNKSEDWDRFNVHEINDSLWNGFSEAIDLCKNEFEMINNPDEFYRE